MALGVGQGVFACGGFSVHEVGAQLPGVAPEQRVRERTVAPVETRQMEPHQQPGDGVQQALAVAREAGRVEQRPIRKRAVEEARGEDAQLLSRHRARARSPHRGHRRQVALLELQQQVVLALRHARRQLLERVDRGRVAHEQDLVARETALDLDDARAARGPGGERKVPGQIEEIRMAGPRVRSDQPVGLPGHRRRLPGCFAHVGPGRLCSARLPVTSSGALPSRRRPSGRGGRPARGPCPSRCGRDAWPRHWCSSCSPPAG